MRWHDVGGTREAEYNGDCKQNLGQYLRITRHPFVAGCTHHTSYIWLTWLTLVRQALAFWSGDTQPPFFPDYRKTSDLFWSFFSVLRCFCTIFSLRKIYFSNQIQGTQYKATGIAYGTSNIRQNTDFLVTFALICFLFRMK